MGASVPNIYEVAKRAGVSTATVSRVLSRPDVVSPDTRRRVMQAVDKLGYTPNSAAKNLRTLRSGKLLVTVPDISNPFIALVLQGIEEIAQREGYAVLLGDTQHDEQREERYAAILKRKEADGLIFLGHRLPKELLRLGQIPEPLLQGGLHQEGLPLGARLPADVGQVFGRLHRAGLVSRFRPNLHHRQPRRRGAHRSIGRELTLRRRLIHPTLAHVQPPQLQPPRRGVRLLEDRLL